MLTSLQTWSRSRFSAPRSQWNKWRMQCELFADSRHAPCIGPVGQVTNSGNIKIDGSAERPILISPVAIGEPTFSGERYRLRLDPRIVLKFSLTPPTMPIAPPSTMMAA